MYNTRRQRYDLCQEYICPDMKKIDSRSIQRALHDPSDLAANTIVKEALGLSGKGRTI